MNRERVAAALEFDRKRRAQDYLMSEPGTQPLTHGEDVLGFLRGVGGNLAGRAQSAYDLATTPSRWIPEAKNAVTGLVEFGKAAISDPAGTGRAIAQGEGQRASQAAGSPEAMGEYAANFIDPLRLAKALRYRGPIAELDVYHGTPHRFPATEANPLGEFDASKIRTGEGAQALEAAPSAFEQRLREQYGDFAQAYNLGVPDTPEYRRIVQEVTAQGPLSDDALREAVKSHSAYAQAGGKAAATELRQSKRGGAAALVDSLSEQGVKARVETSKSPGSRSTYIYASKGGKTVKIRLSDHLPAESGRVYGTNDIMTTPQHWKSAAKRALELLEEAD